MLNVPIVKIKMNSVANVETDGGKSVLKQLLGILRGSTIEFKMNANMWVTTLLKSAIKKCIQLGSHLVRLARKPLSCCRL